MNHQQRIQSACVNDTFAIRNEQPDTDIGGWHIEETELTDGSKVYDLIGASDEALVVFNCVDLKTAEGLQAMLMSSAHVSSASAEAVA